MNISQSRKDTLQVIKVNMLMAVHKINYAYDASYRAQFDAIISDAEKEQFLTAARWAIYNVVRARQVQQAAESFWRNALYARKPVAGFDSVRQYKKARKAASKAGLGI